MAPYWLIFQMRLPLFLWRKTQAGTRPASTEHLLLWMGYSARKKLVNMLSSFFILLEIAVFSANSCLKKFSCYLHRSWWSSICSFWRPNEIWASFFWLCNYTWGGSVAVSLRCWQWMSFAFEVLHLASGKRVHNLAKRKTFCLVLRLRQPFNPSKLFGCWNIHITHPKESVKGRKETNIHTHFIKEQLDHSIRRACCTFPPTFWKIKSESTKSLSVCIINAFRVKSSQEYALNPNLHPEMQEK